MNTPGNALLNTVLERATAPLYILATCYQRKRCQPEKSAAL